MKTLFYKGFAVQAGCGYGKPYPEQMVVRDIANREYLDGRRNTIRDRPFYFATLESIRKAIDHYQQTYPDDPIFHGRWKDSPEMTNPGPTQTP